MCIKSKFLSRELFSPASPPWEREDIYDLRTVRQMSLWNFRENQPRGVIFHRLETAADSRLQAIPRTFFWRMYLRLQGSHHLANCHRGNHQRRCSQVFFLESKNQQWLVKAHLWESTDELLNRRVTSKSLAGTAHKVTRCLLVKKEACFKITTGIHPTGFNFRLPFCKSYPRFFFLRHFRLWVDKPEQRAPFAICKIIVFKPGRRCSKSVWQ